MMGRYIVLILFAVLVEGVFGDADEVKSVIEGDSVTLNTTVIKGPNDVMLWYFEDTRIALVNGDPDSNCLYDGPDGRFRGRLKVDYETGSLIITNIRTEHTGHYEAAHDIEDSSGKSEKLNKPGNQKNKCDRTKIITKSRNLGKTIKTISLTVSGSGLSPGVVAGICAAVGVGLLVAAAGVVKKMTKRKTTKGFCKKSNDEKQNEESHII